ncbi:MAG: aspartate carbamoyltransferase catalytic subunit [Pelagimonas sp.]
MTQIDINGSETHTVRLFHLDLPPEAVDRFVTQAGTGEWPLKYALGARHLRPGFVDVVDIRDLERMPLSKYMVDAHGAKGPDFKAAKPSLDALTGTVILLPSQAFEGKSQTLTIAPQLRFIGSFTEEKPARARGKLSSASTAGFLPQGRPDPNAPSNRTALLLALLGIVLFGALVLLMVLR